MLYTMCLLRFCLKSVVDVPSLADSVVPDSLPTLSQNVTVPSTVVHITASGSSAGRFLGVSGDWQKVVGKVEDGWPVVKGKKGKSSKPSFDMAFALKRKDKNVNLDGLCVTTVVCPLVGNISVSL